MNQPAKKLDNVIPLEVIDGTIHKKKPKLKKDGTPKRTRPNRKKGSQQEVLPIKTKDDIAAVVDVLNLKVKEAYDAYYEAQHDSSLSDADRAYSVERAFERLMLMCRNRLLWMVGMNCGIRASDLRLLKWSDFFDLNEATGEMTMNKFCRFQPVKTKTKYVNVTWNDTVQYAIRQYINLIPILPADLNLFVFATVNDNTPISVQQIWNVVCDTAKEAGIPYNVGTHTLRKTWGYWTWRNAKDKTRALVELQHAFNHASTVITMKYIGLLQEDIEALYMSTNLGIEKLKQSDL